MFREIGAFDAKAKLSELLREVSRGQSYTITVRGKPVADLVPTGHSAVGDPRAAIEAIRAMKKVKGVSARQIREWISEGRR